MKIGRGILMVLVAGCGAADTTDTDHAPLPPVDQPDRAAAPDKTAEADRDCPLALPGAQVTSEVTADGVALVFTTGGGEPAELRDRVHRMAERYNARQVPAEQPAAPGADGEAGGMTSTEGAHGVDMHGQVPSRAAVEETAGGARIVFTPTDPAKVGMLREQIRVHGKEMASSGCSEVKTPAQAPPPGSAKTLPEPEPTPSPSPQEPVMPDRPVTPDQPVTPPAAPPPPTGEPFVQ